MNAAASAAPITDSALVESRWHGRSHRHSGAPGSPLGGRRPTRCWTWLAEHRPNVGAASTNTPVADDLEAERRIEGEVRYRRCLKERPGTLSVGSSETRRQSPSRQALSLPRRCRSEYSQNEVAPDRPPTLKLSRCSKRRIVARPLQLRNSRLHGVKNRRGDCDRAVHPHCHRLNCAVDSAQAHLPESQAQVFKRQKLQSSDPRLVIVRLDRPPCPGVVGERFAKNLTGSPEIIEASPPSLDHHPSIIAHHRCTQTPQTPDRR